LKTYARNPPKALFIYKRAFGEKAIYVLIDSDFRAERRLVRALGVLIKWGWVACDNRQKEEGHKFWYNAYWKTELARNKHSNVYRTFTTVCIPNPGQIG
jgi:hypothetical protein